MPAAHHFATRTCHCSQAPAPIRPLFGGAEAAVGRHLMAASDNMATITAAESQIGTEKLALVLPSGWIAATVVVCAVAMVAVAGLLALRSRTLGGPLPL